MNNTFRITRIMVPVFVAALFMTGCAKVRPAGGPLPPAAAALEAKKVIVAKVNSAELSMDALITMMNNLPEKGAGSAPETVEERKKRALDALVLLELAYQRATALGLNADPVKVQIGMDNFKDNIGGDKEYAEYLTRHNMTEADLRAEVERGLTINLIYTKEVEDVTVVPEEELKKEYEKDKQQFIRPELVSIVDVYLLKDEGKASKKKAKELLAKIKADPAQDPWKLVLDGAFLVRNLTAREDREAELYRVAKKLKPQELSGVIETPKGAHIIKLKEYSPERQLTFEEAKPSIETKLKPPYQDKKTREWEDSLKKDAKIVLLTDAAGRQEHKTQ